MTNLRVLGGGKYLFDDSEVDQILECTSEIMSLIKGKGLTVAETLEVFEQCKASVNELLVK